jgi:hypothetical protein
MPMLETAPDPTPADELAELAGMVRRLRPDWRDSESFYELRSEIAGALMRLSRRLAHTPLRPLPRPLLRPVPARVVRPILRIAPSPPPAPPSPPSPCPAPARPRRVPLRRHHFPRPPMSLPEFL